MLSNTTRSNIRRLYTDMFWFGILNGSAMTFVAVYAARLGAGGMQIGWLTAGPAFLNLLISLPAGRWMANHALSVVTFRSALLQRLGYLVLFALPWLLPDALQVQAMIWIVLVMSLPATIFAIAFNALFADIVPVEMRSEVVGRRNALLAVSMTVATLICGWILDQVVFPFNYQLVFLIGLGGGLLSAACLAGLRPRRDDARWLLRNGSPGLSQPDQSGPGQKSDFDMPLDAGKDQSLDRMRSSPPLAKLADEVALAAGASLAAAPPEALAGAALPGATLTGDLSMTAAASAPRDQTAEARRLAERLADRLAAPLGLRVRRADPGLLRGAFGRFIAAYLLFYTFQYLCVPAFPLAYVNDLGLSDSHISLGYALFNMTMFGVSLRLASLARRWGNRRLLCIGALLFGVFPLAVGLAGGPYLFWIGCALGGGVYALVSAGLVNRLLERVPDGQRAAGMALHNLALNLGILIGSLAGPAFAEWIGVQPSLVASAGLRLLAGLIMLFWA